MLFNSPVFLFVFLPVAFALYLVVGKRLRNPLLVIISLFFYAWGEPKLVVILLLLIAVSYIFSSFINSTRRSGKRRAAQVLLGLGIAFELGVLISFKYAQFVTANINSVADWAGLGLQVELPSVHFPLGISFFTFSAISYLIDLYREDAPFDSSLLNTAVYISFFPKLLAGPIVKYREMAGQIADRSITTDKFASGIQRFILGLGKKVLIADILAGVANQVFGIPADQLTTSVSCLGAICYTLQIYFDFSGYSDMAIGLGRMAGFDFQENFNYPYISQSIQEFWRRWHISLSSWFRDYLYIPLGGNRQGPARTYFNLMTVFFLCGLWHGPSWTFVIWGIWHGSFLILERTRFGDVINKVWIPVRWLYAFVVVTVGWVVFRSPTFSYGLTFVKAMFGFGGGHGSQYFAGMYLSGLAVLVLAAAVIGSFPVFPMLSRYREMIVKASKTRSRTVSVVLETGFSLATLLLLFGVLTLSVVLLAGSSNNPFIYFKF